MTYQAFVMEEIPETDTTDPLPVLPQWLVWTQSPRGFWLLLHGGWPSAFAATRFIERMGYALIDTETGLKQLDQQMIERDRAVRPILHLRSVH